MAALWRSRDGRFSFQVLEDFYATVTRKLDPGLSPAEAQTEARDPVAWRPVVIDRVVLEDAWSVEQQFRLASWDCLIVAAARAAACRYLLTEDLRHGQDIDGPLGGPVPRPARAAPSARRMTMREPLIAVSPRS